VDHSISGLMSATFDVLTDRGRDGKGVLLFFSAGNDNKDLDETLARPWAMYERCFCVSASTLANDGVTETKAKISSYGSTVDFCAPAAAATPTTTRPPAMGHIRPRHSCARHGLTITHYPAIRTA
jgi:hypothetical protein